MKMKRSIRFKAIDFLILFFCLSGATVSLHFFWKDINQIQQKENEKPIATITFKQKTAQRKMSDRVIWDRLQRTSPVYNGDYLRTSTDAEATLTFSDGNAIDIFENTMIQVFFEGEKASVSMDGNGSLALNSSSQTNGMDLLSSDGTKIEVQAGTSLNANAADSIAVQVSSGNATVVNSNGEKIEAKSGSNVEIQKNGTISVVPFSVVAPKANSRLLNFAEGSRKVSFEWKNDTNESSDNTYKTILLETASDKDFTQIIASNKYDLSDAPQVEFNQGTTFWRVTPISETQSAPPTVGKMTIFNCPAPVLRTPTEKTAYNYRLSPPTISFVWKGNETVASYNLEVANNPEMQNPIISRTTTNEMTTLSELEEGTWYWHVIPQYSIPSEDTPSPSTVQSFVITKATELLPPIPAIPAAEEKIVLLPQEFETAQNIYFSWKTDASAVTSILTISSNDNMSEPIFTKTTKDNYLSIPADHSLFSSGTWYWTVSQRDEAGVTSKHSEARSFIFIEPDEAKTELLYPPENYRIAKKLLPATTFSWKAPKTNADAALQIANDKDFSVPIINRKITGGAVDGIELDSGIWYWKVGNSEAMSFNVVEKLPKPTVISPAVQKERLVEKETVIPFTWNAVLNASFYKLTVNSNKENGAFFEIPYITETHANITIPVPNGSELYTWTLEAIASESLISTKINGETAKGTFVVRSPKTVELISPQNNASINGLDALNRPVELSWKSDDPISISAMTIERILPNGKTEKVRTIRNPLPTEKLTRLGEGNYRWYITAQSAGQYNMDSENSFTFTVTQTPLLAPPKGLNPAQNKLFDLNYLKNNRSINFSWQPVSNATEYTFVLYQATASGAIGKKIVEKNLSPNTTSYEFKEFSTLNNGTFIWQVAATRKASDGFIEQAGEVASHTFRINIPLPGKVQIKDTGTQYGE